MLPSDRQRRVVEGRAAEGDALLVCVNMHVRWHPRASDSVRAPGNVAGVAVEGDGTALDGALGVVQVVHADGRCDLQLQSSCDGTGGGYAAGTIVRGLQTSELVIACSCCKQATLPMAETKLFCSGCDRLITDGATCHRAPPFGDGMADVTLCSLCFTELSDSNEQPQLLHHVALDIASFQPLLWKPDEEVDVDQHIVCARCSRSYHYTCARFPAPEQLPHSWRLERERFVCAECCATPSAEPAAVLSSKLHALLTRRAVDLPVCAVAATVEAHLTAELAHAGVSLPSALVVRVASRTALSLSPPASLQQSLGDTLPKSFPYASKALLVFQAIGGHEVCLFAMYVQEYGAQCAAPNTNRVYISYVDSVPYLRTEPPGARSVVYHAVISGYLRSAAARGFEHAHLWVAPPSPGVEYIFHSKPADARFRKPMSTAKLRSWYEQMLRRAIDAGIVSRISSLQEHVEDLTSVREFPLFEGDYFDASKFSEFVQAAKAPATRATRSGVPPRLSRPKSKAIAEAVQREVKANKQRFLVATLQPATGAQPADGAQQELAEPPAPAIDLFASRMRFLELCRHRHWQFDELRRAQWSTMMILATLGGQP